jgi:hypothetical protein
MTAGRVNSLAPSPATATSLVLGPTSCSSAWSSSTPPSLDGPNTPQGIDAAAAGLETVRAAGR